MFDSMLTLHAAGTPLTAVTLKDELRRAGQLEYIGGPHHIALCMEDASLEVYLSSYVKIVRDMAVLRELIQKSSSVIGRAFDAKEDVLGLVDEVALEIKSIQERATFAVKRFNAIRLDELRKLQLIRPWFLVEDWIPGDLLTFLAGDSEAFKSFLAKYIGFCVAGGVPFFGRWSVRQSPVLIISEENGIQEDRRRADLIYAGMGLESDEIPLFIASDSAFRFDDDASYGSMRAFVREHGIKLVIVDSFVRVHRAEEKDAGEMNALYQERIKPLEHEGVAIIALHHKRKLPAGAHVSPMASDNDEIRGSGDIRAMASAIVILRRVGEKKDKKVVVRHNKTRGWDPQDPFVFSVQGGTREGAAKFVYEGKPEDVLDRTEACTMAVLELMDERRTMPRKELLAYFKGKFSKKVLDPVLKTLCEKGYPLKYDKVGREVLYHKVSDAAVPENGNGDDNGHGDDGVPF
jgi:hypothetical protein